MIVRAFCLTGFTDYSLLLDFMLISEIFIMHLLVML